MSRTIQIICIFVTISLCLASWDGPVQTVEREETIPQVIHEHVEHSLDVSNENINDVRQNKVETVLASPKKPFNVNVEATASQTTVFSGLSVVSTMFMFIVGFVL